MPTKVEGTFTSLSHRLEAMTPLAVDLDGTLIKTDLLIESLLALVKQNFWLLLLLPWWLLQGKAYLKEQIAERVGIDARTLPYQTELLSFLIAEREKGRPLLLVTASHRHFADSVAGYLGIFEEVLATEHPTNLSGCKKLEHLIARFGEKGFDYAGNAHVDLKIWPHARKTIVVNPDLGVERAIRRFAVPDRVFGRRSQRFSAAIQALRPYQWVKNILIFIPLLVSHRLLDQTALADTMLAFLAFCCAASSAYLLNDLLDLTADRQHPRKRNRPFASGRLPASYGLAMAAVLVIGAGGIAALLSPCFTVALAAYYVVTLAYSFRLKSYAMLDVLSLAGLYTLRIIAGSAAMESIPSFWLLAFSMFVFLSLALVKRYSELVIMRREGREAATGRSYQVGDLIVLMSAGLASGYLSVLVLALYINSPNVQLLYGRPEAIWLLCPLLLYWISRMWIITHRGLMHDDPIVFTFLDRTGLIIGVLCMGIVVLAL